METVILAGIIFLAVSAVRFFVYVAKGNHKVDARLDNIGKM